MQEHALSASRSGPCKSVPVQRHDLSIMLCRSNFPFRLLGLYGWLCNVAMKVAPHRIVIMESLQEANRSSNSRRATTTTPRLDSRYCKACFRLNVNNGSWMLPCCDIERYSAHIIVAHVVGKMELPQVGAVCKQLPNCTTGINGCADILECYPLQCLLRTQGSCSLNPLPGSCNSGTYCMGTQYHLACCTLTTSPSLVATSTSCRKSTLHKLMFMSERN